MMAPYATHWFDDASVGKNDWWMLLDPIGEGENASVARFQGGFAAGSCFFGLNSDNFCNYSAMPPAGRFLKKAPQKLSGCNPFCSLGRIQSVNQYLRMSRYQPQNLFVQLFKSLAPGRAAGGNIKLNSYQFIYYRRHLFQV